MQLQKFVRTSKRSAQENSLFNSKTWAACEVITDLNELTGFPVIVFGFTLWSAAMSLRLTEHKIYSNFYLFGSFLRFQDEIVQIRLNSGFDT